MTRRRERTLALLARLNRRAAEEAAGELGRLQAEESRLVQDREDLLSMMAQDATPAESEGAPYRAAWMQSLSAETQRLASQAIRMRPEIERAADRVADAFRDSKSVETLQDRAAAARYDAELAHRAEDLLPHLTRLPRG
ncbi:hypothetical protein [Roseivivax sp. CAU 1761]